MLSHEPPRHIIGQLDAILYRQSCYSAGHNMVDILEILQQSGGADVALDYCLENNIILPECSYINNCRFRQSAAHFSWSGTYRNTASENDEETDSNDVSFVNHHQHSDSATGGPFSKSSRGHDSSCRWPHSLSGHQNHTNIYIDD